MERKKVLLALVAGFGLVTLLLIAAAFINVRSLHAIESNTENLLEERRPTAGLIEALDRENVRLGSILIRLTENAGAVRDPSQILTEIKSVAERVAELAKRAPRDANEWARLVSVARFLGETTRSGLSDGHVTAAEIGQVIAAHINYMRATSDLLRSNFKHTNEVQGLIREQSQELARESSWLLALCVLIGAASAGLSIYFTSDAFRRLEWRTAELNRVSWHMLQGQEVAARRFSHEMHDELGQLLTATRATLATVSPSEFVARRNYCLATLDQAIGATRELSQLLRPVILDDFGLNEALRWLCEGFEDRTNIASPYQSNFDERLAEETETHLFRLSQESFTNIARHSGATRAAVTLCRTNDMLTLTIEDNGCGFPPKEYNTGPSLGVIGMQARAEQIGGDLYLGKGTLGGALIRVIVPIRRGGDAS